eukprot:240210_1
MSVLDDKKTQQSQLSRISHISRISKHSTLTYNKVSTDEIDNENEQYPMNSSLLGKYIQLKNVSNGNEVTIYQIQSIKSTNIANKESNIPLIFKENTMKWLFIKYCTCDRQNMQWTHFSIAITVIFIQIMSYILMAYYLISTNLAEDTDRAENCYGPNCQIIEPKCMSLSTGGVTSILLVGFLWPDIIASLSMIVSSLNQNFVNNQGKFIAAIIILICNMTALISGILVGLYTPNEFDAINGAVGILFVHDLDDKMFLAMDLLATNCEKICAFLSWIVLSVLIAMLSACTYNHGHFFVSDSHKDCMSGQFKCNSGECIWYGFVCNGVDDCANGDDEHFFCDFSQIICPHNMLMCESTGSCIDIRKRCDGKLDCVDGSDESREQNCSD